MHDADGDLELFEMIVQDVSEQRRLEAQLRQAQKMEAIGQLTGGIAHDFNNLLSVITLNAQLVAASLEATPGEVLPELEDIQEAARKATTMTKQLLGFSRHADLRMVPTDLARVVAKLSSMMRRVLPENITIRIDAEEAVHAVRADAGAVEQMLLNLATNARDAMPDGGKLQIDVGEREVQEVTLASHPWITPGRYVCIRVRDSGIGMDEETRSRIFEPFFTTKAPGVGTGLGMAMVYGLTKQHGGFVTVLTALGRGTTIELYFPVVGEAAQPLDSVESLDGVRGGSETILLVEDEDTLRRSAKRVLERYGYTVLVAADGQEGLERYRAHKTEIDLVVSDLIMPRVGGAQLHRTLREEGDRVRFLLASGYVGRESGGHEALDPSIPILRKPWALRDLLTRIRELLDQE
jgi:two-component system NtrC family sensor kinase